MLWNQLVVVHKCFDIFWEGVSEGIFWNAWKNHAHEMSRIGMYIMSWMLRCEREEKERAETRERRNCGDKLIFVLAHGSTGSVPEVPLHGTWYYRYDDLSAQ